MLKDAASYRRVYQDTSGHKALATGDGDQTLITGKTAHTEYIQRVIFTVETDAAQTITFEDSAGTPVFVAKTDSSPGAGTRYDFDFGAVGKPLTAAKNFVANVSAAGLAGHIEWESYRRQTSSMSEAAKAAI